MRNAACPGASLISIARRGGAPGSRPPHRGSPMSEEHDMGTQFSDQSVATRGAWGRWAPLVGVAAVVLWVVGIAVDPGVPDLFVDSGEEWLTFVSGNEGGILTSRLLLLIGDFLFILFLGTLRTRLFAAEAEPRYWTAIAFGGRIATAAMLIATSTPVLAAAAAADGLGALSRS